MRSNIKKVFWFYFILFLCIILYLLNFSLIKSKKIVGNTYNPRIKQSIKSDILRGNILDKNGTVLASTIDGKRIQPYGKIFSNIIGKSGDGAFGIEATYNFYLEKVNNELVKRIEKELNKNNDKLVGNSIILTIDKNLQEFAYEKIKDYKGAVVVMNSSTGEVLSMISNPSFDLTKEDLKLENDDSSLFNRATQGLYPPASVFKIIVAISFIENYKDFESYTYKCNGEYELEGNKISCFNNTAHQVVNLEEALAESCNGFFASLANFITPNQLKNTAEKLLFNQSLNFDLAYNYSKFSLKDSSSKNEILQTFIGQGKTLITPLHMALIGNTIANNGIMMKPYIFDSEIDSNGKVLQKFLPQKLNASLNVNIAYKIRSMLEKVVKEGTGQKAQDENLAIIGKTGTAQVENEKDHTWFLGLAPAENPRFTIAIILENSGKSNIVEISKDILKKAVNFN